MYVYVSDKDNPAIYPNNTPDSFTVALPEPLKLRGHWQVALWDIDIKSTQKLGSVYIACNIVAESYANSQYKKLLRRIVVTKSQYNKEFSPPQYVTIDNTADIESIEIEILDADTLEKPSVPIQRVNCTLHLKHGQGDEIYKVF
jgi:hypothetical protein